MLYRSNPIIDTKVLKKKEWPITIEFLRNYHDSLLYDDDCSFIQSISQSID